MHHAQTSALLQNLIFKGNHNSEKAYHSSILCMYPAEMAGQLPMIVAIKKPNIAVELFSREEIFFYSFAVQV